MECLQALHRNKSQRCFAIDTTALLKLWWQFGIAPLLPAAYPEAFYRDCEETCKRSPSPLNGNRAHHSATTVRNAEVRVFARDCERRTMRLACFRQEARVRDRIGIHSVRDVVFIKDDVVRKQLIVFPHDPH